MARIDAARDASPARGLTHGHYKYPARFSPVFAKAAIQLRKRLLGEIKLADLTIGDLAGIASKKEETPAEPETGAVQPFRRRF